MILPVIMITFIQRNTKSHGLKHSQRHRWANLSFSGMGASLVYNGCMVPTKVWQWFHTKFGKKFSLRKRKLARLEKWLAFPNYAFSIVMAQTPRRVFLSWNHHCLLVSCVSVMRPLIMMTLTWGNTKSHRLKHYQRQRWVNL